MKRINTILIANRGEIASRIIRTCKKMGIRSVAVFSEADKSANFTMEADLAILIGPGPSVQSYLDQDKVLSAAKTAMADAIHPGYGFLSENAGFARKCSEKGFIFIGPRAEVIDAMGSKANAKEIMKKHDVPVIPGYQGADQEPEKLTGEARRIGFPVLLKATAGGGGKGMRIVREESEMVAAIVSAKRESLGSFGNDRLLIEKYIDKGRHIEFQIFGDQHGNVIHLYERECTIQRRYQKIIEESPSPIMDETLRTKMGAASLRAARVLNYDNAGTVEFIYDEKTSEFFFLEVNTRLQVEHPVTEETTGLDLVQMQIEVAQGLPLEYSQEDIVPRGYAVECRLYAEDATNNFMPVTGKISRFDIPAVDGLRIETAISRGSDISIHYDPMIAKVIVWDKTRMAAMHKMQYALRNLVCLGIKTNQFFLLHLFQHPDVIRGNYDTHFIEQKIDLGALDDKKGEQAAFALIGAAMHNWQERENRRTLLKSLPTGWRNNFYQNQKEVYETEGIIWNIEYLKTKDAFIFKIDDLIYQTKIISFTAASITVDILNKRYTFYLSKHKSFIYIQSESLGSHTFKYFPRFPMPKESTQNGGYITPMPSQIIQVLVKKGQRVKTGTHLVVLSSMKMENTIEAREDGVIEDIYVREGENVEAGVLLLKIS